MYQKEPFDWSVLDRVTLFGILYDIGDRIVGKALTVNELHNKFVYQIKKFLPVTFRKIFDPKVESGWVYIGGAYYSERDEHFKKFIEINFNYNPSDTKIKLTPRRFSRLCISFADTILHEIIHTRQHRRRNWRSWPDFPSTASRTKQREEQSYLGCRDEIDAYSFNIACELYDRFNGSQPKIIKYLNTHQLFTKRKGDSYAGYLKAFGNDHNHIVIKNLKKKVVSYLPQAELGKPYRSSEWLKY